MVPAVKQLQLKLVPAMALGLLVWACGGEPEEVVIEATVDAPTEIEAPEEAEEAEEPAAEPVAAKPEVRYYLIADT